MAKTTINSAALRRSLNNAFALTANELNAAYKAEIEASKWSWPRETKRKNGSVVTSPRDIVDKGDLRDSQKMQVTGLIADYTWEDPGNQHEGNAAQNRPGRPWTRTAHGSKNWGLELERHWHGLL